MCTSEHESFWYCRNYRGISCRKRSSTTNSSMEKFCEWEMAAAKEGHFWSCEIAYCCPSLLCTLVAELSFLLSTLSQCVRSRDHLVSWQFCQTRACFSLPPSPVPTAHHLPPKYQAKSWLPHGSRSCRCLPAPYSWCCIRLEMDKILGDIHLNFYLNLVSALAHCTLR